MTEKYTPSTKGKKHIGVLKIFDTPAIRFATGTTLHFYRFFAGADEVVPLPGDSGSPIFSCGSQTAAGTSLPITGLYSTYRNLDLSWRQIESASPALYEWRSELLKQLNTWCKFAAAPPPVT